GRLLERAGEERRQPGAFEALDDVGAGARILLGAARASAHLGGGEDADVTLERPGDKPVADGCRGRTRRRRGRRGAREVIDEDVASRPGIGRRASEEDAERRYHGGAPAKPESRAPVLAQPAR